MQVHDHEYLGISISHDICWKKHCNEITKKASKSHGFLHCTLAPCSKEVKIRAYLSIVRPQHEYAAEAWNTRNITTADRLERIQRAVA